LAAEVLSLPIGPHHTEEQIDHVCAAVREFFAR
jgi:dTDP-4-amino-4,6-dideoxygalactose transaminase